MVGAKVPAGRRDAARGRLGAVRCGAAEGTPGQRTPGRDLETRALELDGDVERGPFAGEIFIELPDRARQDRMIRIAMRPAGHSCAFQGRRWPDNRAETVVGRDEGELANRGGMGGAVEHRLVWHD